MQKKRFTYDQHVALGDQLKQARRIVLPTVTKVGNQLGCSSKSFKTAARTLSWLDRLRCELDNVLSRDFPDRDYQGVYYGDC